MREYIIKKVEGRPSWSEIPELEIDHRYFDTPDSISAKAQICYNDDAICVRLSTVEANIRALETGPVGMPCEDSCLEFFFCPCENDDRYFNIEFNSVGCMFLGMGPNVHKLVRLIPEEEPFSPEIIKREDGWEISYTVTYEFIRRLFPEFKVYSGKRMRANCYKCADFSEPPHYMAWSPIVGEPFKFHRPECFGEMIFD